MFELMKRIWDIRVDTAVPRQAVIENGFDPNTPAPDLDHYL